MLMPVLFLGHGSPMNAIEDNAFSRAWRALGEQLPPPQAILCVSAHWETNGVAVTAMERPRTIHDFYGFPPEMYAMRYPAPGAPAWAEETRRLLAPASAALDQGWGLDHGAWSVLARLYPQANIPTFQLSLDRDLSPAEHYALAARLRPLRERGVLVVGSGNIVHNLGVMTMMDGGYNWADAFDAEIARLIEIDDIEAIIHYERLAHARQAIPTNEHYLPLLYALALRDAGEPARFICAERVFGSISMRGVVIGLDAQS